MENEKDTEKYLCEQLEAKLHGIAYKFNSSQRRSVPDRLCILPNGRHFFVEVKSQGKHPTPAQQREIRRLRDMEHPTWVVDSKAAVDHTIRVVTRVTGGYDD